MCILSIKDLFTLNGKNGAPPSYSFTTNIASKSFPAHKVLSSSVLGAKCEVGKAIRVEGRCGEKASGTALVDSRNDFVNVTGVYIYFFVCAYNLTFYGAGNTNGNVKCVV